MSYTIPELAILSTILSFIFCLFIAIINVDSVNSLGVGYYNTLKGSFSKNGGIIKFIEIPFVLTLNIASITNHPGWKAGLSIFSLLLSFILIATLVFLIYINSAVLWQSVLWPVLKWVLIIGVVLIVFLIWGNK